MTGFKELGLSPELLGILEQMHFTAPSEIQEKVIPLALAGKDVIGQSATGSGKTLAFGAPIIEKLNGKEGLKALILTPTRELTEQVSKSLAGFAKHKHLKIVTVYGGVSINPQIEDIKYADVVVGTPGRILDHLTRRTINFGGIKFLVLDEADRMLDMGFLKDVTNIINHCSKNRQTLLFSATMSSEIVSISKKYMNHPIEVSVESYVDPSKLEQVYYEVSSKEKFSVLVHLLKEEQSRLVMVFCNTKRNARFIGDNLRRYGFDALALHGDLGQNQRNKVLERFHKSEKFILVCTDVAARGLDIKNVSHVYNYDSPKTSEEYIHRVGRTARAGKEGKAITILSERDHDNFRRVLSDKSLNIKRVEVPVFERVFVKMGEERERHGGYSRGRSFGRSGGGNRRGGFGGRRDTRSHGSSRGQGERSHGGPRRFGGGNSGGFGRSRGFGSGERRGGRGGPRGHSRGFSRGRFR